MVTKAKSLGLRVQRKMCETCIYRPDSTLDIKELERQVADQRMEGYFEKFRACHHATRSVVCRGFWDRHKDSFTLGQLAQRLGCVNFVDIDTLKIKGEPKCRKRKK